MAQPCAGKLYHNLFEQRDDGTGNCGFEKADSGLDLCLSFFRCWSQLDMEHAPVLIVVASDADYCSNAHWQGVTAASHADCDTI